MAIVLIVEDDEQVRMLAESILQAAGHETRSASTVTEAHAIIESDEKIDALSDQFNVRLCTIRGELSYWKWHRVML